jgi:hypothetical protein
VLVCWCVGVTADDDNDENDNNDKDGDGRRIQKVGWCSTRL